MPKQSDQYANRKSLYNSKAWHKLRKQQLAIEPCCKYCDDVGHVVLATIVDHIKRHKGDEKLFFDADNLQSLCKEHHDSTKRREENSGAMIGCDANGVPHDPEHHWNN